MVVAASHLYSENQLNRIMCEQEVEKKNDKFDLLFPGILLVFFLSIPEIISKIEKSSSECFNYKTSQIGHFEISSHSRQ